MRPLLFLLSLLLLPATVFAWQGKAIHIADGDTITVLRADHMQVKVRLYGIDAPESKQDFGARAKDALAALVGNTMVDIQEMDEDRYGRIVGMVTPDGQQTSANEMMVAQGMAWVYPQYCTISICERWQQLEAQARASKAGLWRQTAQPPWEWRHGGSTSPAPQAKQEASAGEMHGNAGSHIYHGPSCRYYNCKACVVKFRSPQDAEAAGFRACKVCGGR